MSRSSARQVCSILILALLAASPARAKDGPVRGGTAVVAMDVAPGCLNVLLRCGTFFVTSVTAGVALPGAFRIRPDSTYEPVLVDRVTVHQTPRFALTYDIKHEAVWSDGTPVTSDDFVFTLETIMNPDYDVPGRIGHDRIVAVKRLGAKRVRFEFAGPYAPWRTLFGTVLPRHALEGHDFNQVWNDGVIDPRNGDPIGAGPFLVTGRVGTQSLTLSRNARWWGPKQKPYLDVVEFRFMPLAAQIEALRGGEVDLIVPQPAPPVLGLVGQAGIVIESDPTRNLEHLDFRTTSEAMPLLANAWFRRAVAYAIDREGVASTLYDPFSPGLGATHSLFYSRVQPEYDPAFAGYEYDEAAVTAIMTENGCAKGGDGIWACGGVRASVRLATTAGNVLREQAQAMFVTQAAGAGIEIVADNSPAGVLFGERLPAGAFELIMFTWVKGAEVGAEGNVYGCGGAQNAMGYCSQEVTDLLEASDAELDPAARAGLVNAANAILAADVPTIPLFNRPALLVYRDRLRGARNNPTNQGMVWNIEDWWLGD
jgi:peptide/nickel transport system substrate-binding protein